MTSTLTHVTAQVLFASPYKAVAQAAEIILIVLMITLLVERELVRAAAYPRRLNLGIATVTLVPLMIVFGVILTSRLARLLP